MNDTNRRESQYIDGHRAYSCSRCCDTGIVSVISPRAMRERKERITPWVIRTCAVACDCDAGASLRRPSSRFRPTVTYSGSCMVRATGDATVDGQALDAHLAACEKSRRVTMFDEWNNR